MTVERPVASIDTRYYLEDKDRHGNVRRYFRKRIPGGTKFRKVRLREAPGTPEFHQEFAAALAGRPYRKEETRRPEPPTAATNSLRWLVEEYYRKSTIFRGYDDETKKVRRNILKALCAEPETEGSSRQVGDLPYEIPRDKIVVLLDRKAVTSIDGANARLKALRQVYNWAVSTEPKLIAKNIANDIELLPRVDTGGHHTWTIEEILRFVEAHPAGTKA